MERTEDTNRLEGFKLLFTITEIFGAILLIAVYIWTGHYRGGFAWNSDPKLQFNWHPLLMTVGYVFLYGNGILIYRSQRNIRKPKLKLLHAGIFLFTLFFVLIATIAVFDSHNYNTPPIPNLYSLHSWIGLTTSLLFVCQWIGGLVTFLYPGLKGPLRSAYYPIHVYFGTAGYVGVIAACLTGLTEKAIYGLDNYAELSSEAYLINFIGLLIIIFGGLVLYLSSQERYKRLPRPEDDLLLANRNQ